VFRLEGTVDGTGTDVVGLSGGELGELGTEVLEVEGGDLLVEDLGEEVDVGLVTTGILVVVAVGPEFHLSENLVAEGVGHDEGRVAGGAAEVDEAALSEEDDVVARLHGEAINLGLDLDALDAVGLELGDLDFSVEVTDVAEDGVVAHLFEVLLTDDVVVTGGGDDDVGVLDEVLDGGNLVTFHAGLEGVDGVDFGDDDASTEGAEGGGGALTDITVSGDEGGLAGDHDVGGALDTVDERFTAAVEVVELGLGDGVVDVDGGDGELAVLLAAVEVLDTSGGFFGDTEDTFDEGGVLVDDEVGHVTTVIEDHVGLAVTGEALDGLFDAPVVFFVSFTLPGEDGDAGLGDGGGGGVVGGEDVAGAPADFSTDGGEGLDEDGGLDGHVEATGDLGTLEGLGGGVLTADFHESGHFVFGEGDGLAAPFGEGDVLNLVVSHCFRFCFLSL